MVLRAGHAPAGTFRLYLPLIDHLAARGIDVDAFLAEVGLPPELTGDPDAQLRRSEQEAIWRHAIEVSGDPLLPARVASEFPPETIGVIVYLARASADGLDAVRRVQDFIRLAQDEGSLELDFEPGLAVLRVRSRDGHTPILPICEFHASLHVFIGRALSEGGREPREIRISWPAPPHAAELERFLGVPLRYGAADNGVAYPRAEFVQPLRNADPGLSQLLETYARELLKRLPVTDSFADRVRAAVLPRLSRGSPGIEDIAKQLRMSARSVRRRLREEGSTYREILDGLRRELALRCLETGEESIEGIARDLGFSDASAFHKAFRRWTGQSPAAFARARARK